MDIMATEKTATIKTSAVVAGLVTGTQFAETPTALTLVDAIPVFMVTAIHAMMSVNGEATIVIRKVRVLILEDHIIVLVRKDITETAGSVKASKPVCIITLFRSV